MKVKISESNILNIVGDAGIAAGTVGDGRFIVVLIIDHEDRTDIEDLFKIHSTTGEGEVKVNWGAPLFSDNIFLLNILFASPAEVAFSIKFEIDKHGILIENIINSKAVYLQLGKKGDRVSNDLSKTKILLEIPDTGIKNKWHSLLQKNLIKKFRDKGYDKKESKDMAINIMKEMRKFKNLKVS